MKLYTFIAKLEGVAVASVECATEADREAEMKLWRGAGYWVGDKSTLIASIRRGNSIRYVVESEE